MAIVIRYRWYTLLFSIVDSNELRFDVKIEMMLICAKFGTKWSIILKLQAAKNKWPRFYIRCYVTTYELCTRDGTGSGCLTRDPTRPDSTRVVVA